MANSTADGSVVIDVDMNVSQAEKRLAKLRGNIKKTEQDIAKMTQARNEAEEKSLFQGAELDKEKAKLQEIKNQLAEIRALSKDKSISIESQQVYASQIPALKQELDEQRERVRGLQTEWNVTNRSIASYNSKIESSNQKLASMKTEAGILTQKIDELSKSQGLFKIAAEKSAESMSHLVSRVKGLISRVFVFSVITRALRSLVKLISNYIRSNDEASQAIAQLKGALLTLAQPIIEVIIPAFIKLVQIITKVVSAIAQFVSILFGKTISQSKDSAKAMYDEANAISGVGGAASDAAKELANFDEINKLSDSTSGGGGGGNEILPDFSSVMELPEWLEKLKAAMHFNIKDLFFDFEDLTPEDILAKVVAGLTTLTGALIGFALGGPGGAIIGTIVGATIGLVIANLLFDGDGHLSKEEIAKLVLPALFTLAGGVIGFTVGGPGGALIGLTVGAASSLILNNMIFDNDGVLSKVETALLLATVLGALVGGIIGFVAGGPGGALLGAFIGAGAVVVLTDMITKSGGEIDKNKFLNGLITVLGALLGGAIGFVVGGPAGALLGATIGLGITLAVQSIDTSGVRTALSNVDKDVAAGIFGKTKISPEISTHSIPALARGAVIPPNREFLAVLGDQKNGTNIETPLATMVQAFRQALSDMGYNGSSEAVLMLDRDVLGKVVYRLNKAEGNRIGVNLAGV